MKKQLKNRQSGQTLIGFAIILSGVLVYSLMLHNQATVKSFAESVSFNETSFVRSSFLKASKNLRYMYQTLAMCNPEIFVQAVRGLPNPAGMAGDVMAAENCNIGLGGTCRALEISSVADAAANKFTQPTYVFVGGISFNRVDVLTNDFGTIGAIPTSSVGVHLRMVVNNMRYEQWIVLIDTCSSMEAPAQDPLVAPDRAPGVGFGSGWQLGSALSPVGGVIVPALGCGGGRTMGDVSYLDFKRITQLIEEPYTAAIDFPNPDCMDLTQDGIIDEKDLNIHKKFLMGWIPAIPIR